MLRVSFAFACAALLAGCTATGGAVGPSATATPTGPSVISGSGDGFTRVAGPAACAGPISDYQRIIDRDVETGMLNPGVYNRVSTDLDPVKQACAAGREAEANQRLAAVKQQYGYR